jgi:nitrogen fixation protein NifZ
MNAGSRAAGASLGGATLGGSTLGASTLGVGVDVLAAVQLRQDGSFPDPSVAVGEVLVPAGTSGQIIDVGTYLGEHVVYAVMFETGRVVGCLARELRVAPERPARTAALTRIPTPGQTRTLDVSPPKSTGGTP